MGGWGWNRRGRDCSGMVSHVGVDTEVNHYHLQYVIKASVCHQGLSLRGLKCETEGFESLSKRAAWTEKSL